MIEFLVVIGNSLKYFYLLALLAGILYWRGLTTFNLVTLVLFVSEVAMNLLRDPLWAFVGSLEFNEAVIVWCLTWSLCYFLAILLMHFLHSRLRVAMGREATVIGFSMLSLVVLQILRYVEALYFDSWLITELYRWGIPSINVSMGGYLLFTFLREVRNDRSIRANSSF